MRPLITRPALPWALLIVGLGAVVFLALAAVVWNGTTTRFDTWAAVQAFRHFGSQQSTGRRALLFFSLPEISIAVPVVVGVWAIVKHRWRVLALAALGPALALAVTEVAKPVIHRVIGPAVYLGSSNRALPGSYPSGHETATVGWLLLLVLVVLPVCRNSRHRAAVVTAAVVWTLLGALGLTVNSYHYATDTIGAIGSTTAVVLGVALAVDVVADRRTRVSSPDARNRPRTSRAA